MSSCVHLDPRALLPAVFITVPVMQQPGVVPPGVKLPTGIDALQRPPLIYYFLPQVQLTLLKII